MYVYEIITYNDINDTGVTRAAIPGRDDEGSACHRLSQQRAATRAWCAPTGFPATIAGPKCVVLHRHYDGVCRTLRPCYRKNRIGSPARVDTLTFMTVGGGQPPSENDILC